jgi:alkanesulfonate monooxygenase SsuD/methylene tetrahydromethanopterin reductase-like flavin-dependent oxidoreductase (luciferase family)
MPLKFSVFLPFFYPDIRRPYRELADEMLEIAKAADELGFESVVIPEHHFFNYICNPSALQFATLAAAHTERLRLLTGVIVLPYYHPLALAEEIAQVDHISRGRLEVGLARGANKYEFDRLGIDWRNSRAMYEESLDILLRAWSEDDLAYDGQFWSFPSVTAIPRPHQRPHPKLWVSAQSLQGVQAVAQRDLNLMTSPNLGSFAPHGDLEKVLGTYSEVLADQDAERRDVMVLRRVFVGKSEDDALRRLDAVHLHWQYYMSQYQSRPATESDRLQERTENEGIVVRAGSIQPADVDIDRSDVYHTYDDPIMTDPERAIARFQHYERLGVTHVAMLTAFGLPLKDVLSSMRLIAKEIMPAFGARNEVTV